MDKDIITNKLVDQLYNLYTSKNMSKFFEFCQGEKKALLELSLSKRDITPTDLRKKLNVSKQRITFIINSLKDKKYITLQMDENDRRKIIIKLSKTGKKYIDKESELILNEVKKELEKFTIEDLEQLTNFLSKFNDVINED